MAKKITLDNIYSVIAEQGLSGQSVEATQAPKPRITVDDVINSMGGAMTEPLVTPSKQDTFPQSMYNLMDKWESERTPEERQARDEARERSEAFRDQPSYKRFGQNVESSSKMMWGGLKYGAARLYEHLGWNEWAQKEFSNAEQLISGMPYTEQNGIIDMIGAGVPMLGGFGIAAAITAASGGTAAAPLAGVFSYGQLALLGGSAYGNALMTSDEYEKETGAEIPEWHKQGVAIGAAATEFAFEYLRYFKTFMPKQLTGKFVQAKFLSDPKLTGRILNDFAKRYPSAFKQIGRVGTRLTKQGGWEAIEEPTNQWAQMHLDNTYRLPGDKYTGSEIGAEMWTAGKQAFVTGFFLFGGSQQFSQSMLTRMSRKTNGITLVTTKDGDVLEVMGMDAKSGNLLGMNSWGETVEISKDKVEDNIQVSQKDLNIYLDVYRKEGENLEQIEKELYRKDLDKKIEGLNVRNKQTGNIVGAVDKDKNFWHIIDQAGENAVLAVRANTKDNKTGEDLKVVIGPDGKVVPEMKSNDYFTVTGDINYTEWKNDFIESSIEKMFAERQNEDTMEKATNEVMGEGAIKGEKQYNPGDAVNYNGQNYIIDEVNPDNVLAHPEDGDPLIDSTEIPLSELQAPIVPVDGETSIKDVPLEKTFQFGKEQVKYFEKEDGSSFIPIEEGMDADKVMKDVKKMVGKSPFDVIPITEEIPIEGLPAWVEKQSETVTVGISIVPKGMVQAEVTPEITPEVTPEIKQEPKKEITPVDSAIAVFKDSQSLEDFKNQVSPEEYSAFEQRFNPGKGLTEQQTYEKAVDELMGDKAELEKKPKEVVAPKGEKKEFSNVDAALNAAIKAAKEGDSKKMNSIISEWKNELTKDDVDEIKGNLKDVKEDKKPAVKESLTVEKKPEVKQPKTVVKESPLSPEAKERMHNSLIDRIREYNSIPKGHSNKRSEAYKGIMNIANKLKYALGQRNGRLIATDNGSPIKMIAQKTSQEVIDRHKALEDYSPETQEFINTVIETSPDLFGLYMPQISSKERISAIKNIQEGKKTVAANLVLDALETMYLNGGIEIYNNQTKANKFVPTEFIYEEKRLITNQKNSSELDNYSYLDYEIAFEKGLITKDERDEIRTELESTIQSEREAEDNFIAEFYGNQESIEKGERAEPEVKKGEQGEMDFNIVEERKSKYTTKDGQSIQYSLAFGETETKPEKQSDRDKNPSLRKLKEGEFAYVERKYSSDKNFSFSGKDKIETYDDVAYIFRNLEKASIENSFFLILKDGKPIIFHTGMGSFHGVVANDEALNDIVSRFKPEAVYFIHNHPSGRVFPSDADVMLLKRIKAMYPDIVRDGVILDVDTGYYGVFTELGQSDAIERPKSQPEKKVKVLKFDKQVINQPSDKHVKVTSSKDVAELLTSHRLGTRNKISYLVLTRGNNVVANIHTNIGDILDIEQSDIQEIGSTVARFGGSSIIIYGRFPGHGVASVKQSLKTQGVVLLDVMSIDSKPDIDVKVTGRSFADEGIVEPETRYETKQVKEDDALFKHGSISEGIDSRSQLGLYSTVQRAINSLKQAKGTPAQMKAMLLAGGAKQAELDWYEWDNFSQDKKSLTKDEIQDWFDGRKIEVREVVLKDRMEDQENVAFEIYGKPFDELTAIQQNEVWEEYQNRQSSIPKPTKFSQYQLPGGENYREMLLTMPYNEPKASFRTFLKEKGIPDTPDVYGNSKIETEYNEWFKTKKDLSTAEREEMESLGRRMNNEIDFPQRDVDRYNELQARTANRIDNNFKSSHFEEPNIVVHVRMNDRLTKDGKRILFLEEVQSDWAQKGKKEGFKKGLPDGYTTGQDGQYWMVYDNNGDPVAEGSSEQDAINNYFTEGYGGSTRGNIPNMPFKKTDQWVGLAMKRMLIYAAENGYEGISWTTGEQQAERYDLSKQLTQVAYNPKTGWLAYITKGDDRYSTVGEGIKQEQLPDYIGKEAAEKILKQPLVPAGFHVLENADLKVGGEGMKAFYDQIIPNWVNKNLKKYGVKSGETQIEIDGKTEKTNFIPITDQIREVVPEGLPMFRLIGEATSKATTAADIINKKGLSNRQIKTIGNKLRVLAMKTNAKIQVVNRQSELSQSLQDEIGDYSVPGVFKGGTSYLILENMESEAHAIETFIHEVGIHRGIRNLIPNESDRRDFFNKLVDDIGLDEIRKVVHPNYMKAYDKGELTKHLLGEEYMAYLAEKKLDPNKVLTKKEQTWWDSFIEKINEILSKIFNVKTKITEQDVLKIAEAAIQSNFQMRQSDSSVGRAVDQNIRGESQGNNQAKPIRPGVRFAGELLNDPARKKIIGEVGATNLDRAEEATTRMDNLRVAREMETAGKDAKAIKLATGWERGADKLWRYEVADDQMYYNFPEILTALDEGKYYVSAANDYVLSKTENEALTGKRKGVEIRTANTVVYPLEQVLGKDSETFKAYPTLRNAKVVFDNSLPASSGFWSPSNQEIHISLKQPDSDEVRNILIHELQHAIQDREGFAMGGNVMSAKASLTAKEQTELSDLIEALPELESLMNDTEFGTQSRRDAAKAYVNAKNRIEELSPRMRYERLAGEVESRNVQLRSVMSPEMRRETLLSETEDVAREDQIFLQENLGKARSENVSIRMPRGIKKVDSFTTNEGKFSYYDIEKQPRGRAQYFTVHEDKNGWVVRNVILPESERGKGIATEMYKYLNEQSLIKTGKPLVSTRPRTLSSGETLTELSKDGEKLWERLVKQGYAVKTGEKLYEFIDARKEEARSEESDIRLKLPNIENDESLRKELESNKEDREKLLSTLNEVQRKLTDRDVAAEVFLDQLVEKYKGKVTDQSNVAAALNLYNPRKQEKEKQFNRKLLDPFIETMKQVRRAAKVTFDDVNIYMRAKHAPERNLNIINWKRGVIEKTYQERLESLDKKDPKYNEKAAKLINDKNKKSTELEKQVLENDNYSGFTTEEAIKIRDKFESKLDKKLIDKFWGQIKSMTDYHLNELLDGGLISKESYDKFMAQYEYYVPLKGWDREGDPEFGYVQDMGGILSSPIKKAKGRQSMSDDPLPYIVNAAYSAIVQNEKARIAKAASLLISQNKELFAKHNLGGIRKTYIVKLGFNEDGTVKEVEYDEKPPQEYFDKGMVRTKNNTPFPYEVQRSKYEAKAHEVVAYADGQRYIIWFSKDDPAVANAINRKIPANIEAANSAFQKFPGTITRFMAGNFTVRSINFVFGNLFRDLPLSTVSNYIDNGMKGGAGFLYQTVNIQPTLRREMHGKLDPNNKMDKYMIDFMEGGGRTGFSYLQDIKAVERNIKRTLRIEQFLDKAGVLRLPITALPKLIKGIEALAGWSEDVSRFATYVAEREGGSSHMKAVMAAKNVSVNFDKKGELSGTLGSFYAFFNATMRAVVKYGQMWEKAPMKMGGVHLFLMTQGFIMARLMDMFGGLDDDDEEKKYDNLSDYKKYFYLNIPIINISIPMPHILRVPHSFGVAAYDVWSGRKSMGDAMKTVAGMSLGEFSPINPQDFISRSGEMSLMPISPTALRPAFELMANQNFMGLPIYKEMYTPKLELETADAAKHFKRVGPGFKAFTKSLYMIGGGNEHMDKFIWKNGENKMVREAWDWNPAKIEHVYNAYLGGPAKLFNQSAKMAEMTIEAANDIINGKEFKEAIQNYDSRYMPVIYQFRVNTYGSSLERYWYDQLETMGVYESGLSKADRRGEYDQYGDMLRSDLHKKFEQYQVASELIDMFREMMDSVDKDSPEYKEYEKKIRDVMKNYREKVDSLEKEINNK